ncbi:MAG: class I adenylate-forming enzyme family protein, partial [Planctomycetota bacterium]
GWLANAAAKKRCVPQDSSSRRVTLLPIAHSYARTCDVGTWLISGGHLILGLGSKDFRLIQEHAPTHMNLVPKLADQLADLMKTPDPKLTEAIRRMQNLGVGGATLDQSTYETWTSRGIAVTAGYGLTESGPVICSATPENSRPDTVGCLVDDWEHQIVNGELWVRGPAMMVGYFKDQTSTNQRIVDGWLRTGDEVSFDEDGHFRILGRIDQVLVMHDGNKIHPEAAERLIRDANAIHGDLFVDSPDGRRLRIHVDHHEDLVIPKDLRRYPTEIHQWDPPVHPSERTSKGTIRRDIIKKRYSQRNEPVVNANQP